MGRYKGSRVKSFNEVEGLRVLRDSGVKRT